VWTLRYLAMKSAVLFMMYICHYPNNLKDCEHLFINIAVAENIAVVSLNVSSTLTVILPMTQANLHFFSRCIRLTYPN
jgi:hypothetical protein